MLRKLPYTYFIEVIVCLLFLSISLYIAPYHEHWADEAQAFLIARDANWEDIVTKIPHQEGQPALWHILLKGCMTLFGDELNISYVSISVMFMAVILIIFVYPIPLLYKMLLPFGYYFLYQYNIIARNYCLAYLALVVLGISHNHRHKHPYLYALSLIFLAETTSFYSIVALILGLKWIYENKGCLKNILWALMLLFLGGISLIWQILPTDNYVIPKYFFPLPLLFLRRIFDAFCLLANHIYFVLFAIMVTSYFCNLKKYHFTPQKITNLLFIFLCVTPFLLVFSEVHHGGLIYGLFLLLSYILFPNYLQQGRHHIFLIILIMQMYQSVIFIIYDKMFSYTAVPLIIETLQRYKQSNQKIRVLSYSAIPVFIEINKSKLKLNPSFFTKQQFYNDWQKRSCADYSNLQENIVIVDKTSFLL